MSCALLVTLLLGQVEAPPPPPPPPSSTACVPGCRGGYLCVQGQCVSACNPPCDAHERCTAARECVPAAAAAPPAAVSAVPPDAPQPGGGVAMAVTGGVLLGVGLLSLTTTLPFWIDGLDLDEAPGERGVSSDDARDLVIASSLSAFGLAAAITGAILLPAGISKARAASQQAWRRPEVTPRFALAPGGAWLGVAVRF